MEAIAEKDIRARIERDNPWWNNGNYVAPEASRPKRVYLPPFKRLSLNFGVRRAAVLLGPRRVGKTFMLKQLIQDAIDEQIVDRKNVLYASIDTPVYSGISLEDFLYFLPSFDEDSRFVVVFDEIQYLKDWETHLKDLVDSYPNVKFIASGSAAAALQLKSRESGAGRFSDFMMPPLTFYEFLNFIGQSDDLVELSDGSDGQAGGRPRGDYYATNIERLNERFIDYLNYGGYPEAVLNEEIRKNPEQFIRNDIIDKVLLKDLPSLYGINEIQELNRLFSFLAFNSGNEASLENISQESGLAKQTIKKYIEYLESAFLIIKISTVDDNCRTMKRARNFKIYLNNPSMRAALFGPVSEGETDRVGHLAEAAIFAQWQHSPSFRNLRYARWRNEGEVDIVYLFGPALKPAWIGEIKWSDRVTVSFSEQTKGISVLLKRHPTINQAFLSTKSYERKTRLEGRELHIVPTSVLCYAVGRNITSRFDVLADTAKIPVPGEAEEEDADLDDNEDGAEVQASREHDS